MAFCFCLCVMRRVVFCFSVSFVYMTNDFNENYDIAEYKISIFAASILFWMN